MPGTSGNEGKPHLLVTANTVFAPDLLASGGHRHVLCCLKYWEAHHRITVQCPQFVARQVQGYALAARIVPTLGGSIWKSNRLLGMLLRTLTCLWVPEAEIYYASSHFLPDIVGPSLRRLMRPKKRFVVMVHHLVNLASRQSAGAQSVLPMLAERLALLLFKRTATAVIAGSDEAEKSLLACGFNPAIIKRSSNAVGNSMIRRQTAREAEAARLTVCYIGRICKRKGIADLLQAWRVVLQDVPAARLTIAGNVEPSERNEMLAIIEAAGSSVQFIEGPSDSLVADIYVNSFLFATASFEEGWGITLAEAMRSGLPCVTYDLPAFPSVFPAGRLAVPVGDYQKLGELLRGLLIDESRRASMSNDAFELSENFDWGKVAFAEARFFG